MTAPGITASDTPPGCEPGGRWLPLADYGYSRYEVWSRGGHGRDQQPVRSVDRFVNGRQFGGLLKVGEGSRERPGGPPRAKGYLRVTLVPDEGKRRPVEVHILVLLANAGRPSAGMETRHLDNDPWNNRWEPGDEETTRAAGGNLIYGTAKENHNDQVKAGTALHPPLADCVNHARCGGKAVRDGRRCLPCMKETGAAAAVLLWEGMPRADVAVELGYKPESGPHVEGLARSYGGYKKTAAQTAAQARTRNRPPKRTLRQRVTGWFRRKGGR